MWALENGTSVVICNGTKNTRNNIRRIIAGERIGTFFSLDTLENFGQPVEVLAQNGMNQIPHILACYFYSTRKKKL